MRLQLQCLLSFGQACIVSYYSFGYIGAIVSCVSCRGAQCLYSSCGRYVSLVSTQALQCLLALAIAGLLNLYYFLLPGTQCLCFGYTVMYSCCAYASNMLGAILSFTFELRRRYSYWRYQYELLIYIYIHDIYIRYTCSCWIAVTFWFLFPQHERQQARVCYVRITLLSRLARFISCKRVIQASTSSSHRVGKCIIEPSKQ